jgi:hypothetical protein
MPGAMMGTGVIIAAVVVMLILLYRRYRSDGKGIDRL